MHRLVSLLTALTALVLGFSVAAAGAANAAEIGPSGLPLPRFVSLKSNRVNLRVGPGLSYAVEWRYMKAGLPVEITQEFDNWRRVRDADGAEGWVNQSLLSGRRTGVVAPWQAGKDVRIKLHSEPDDNSATAAIVEPGVIGSIEACNGKWCRMDFKGHTGWIEQSQLWGAYPGETIKD